MGKIFVVTICLLAAGVLAGGCYATKSDVQKGLANTKETITIEQTKQLEERGIQNLKKIEVHNNRIDNEIMPKIVALDSKAYTNQQNIAKLIDEYIAELRKEIRELKSRIEALEARDNK